MELNEVAMVGDPARVVGWGHYRYTEDEFDAACRAAQVVARPWLRPRFGSVLYFAFWHLLLAVCIYWAFTDLERRDDRSHLVMGLFFGLPSALVLWIGLYGRSRQIKALFHAYPLAGEEFAAVFTPDRYILHAKTFDTSEDWSLLRRAWEFRDGFLLQPLGFAGGYWIPDHALKAPFDHEKAAAFLKSRGVKYRVIDLHAGTSHDRARGEADGPDRNED